MIIRYLICAAVLLVLMLALIGCDSGDGSRKQLLEAIDKTDSAQSYQMTVSSSAYDEEGELLLSYDYEEKRASNGDFWSRIVGYGYDSSVGYGYDSYDACDLKIFVRPYSKDAVTNDSGDSRYWELRYWELIRIGDMIYCRDEEDGEWLDCSEPRIVNRDGGSSYSWTVIVEDKGLQYLRWLVVDEILTGIDLDGTECTYYRGTVDMEGDAGVLAEN
jgi:hypothetical protein